MKTNLNEVKRMQKIAGIITESHLREAIENLDIDSTLSKLEKEIPGVTIKKQDIESDPEEGYDSVESYSIEIPGLGGGYGEDELYINVYNGNSFCFFYDSAPIPTSLHTPGQANKMSSTGIEIPLDINKLSKNLFDEVVAKIKENNS